VTSATGAQPGVDPVSAAIGDAVRDILNGLSVSISSAPDGAATFEVHLDARVEQIVGSRESRLGELVAALPSAAARVAAEMREPAARRITPPPALRRAVRDMLAAEVLTHYLSTRLSVDPRDDLVEDTIEYLVELAGVRVEAHSLTHGVVVTDVLKDAPTLELRYPEGLRAVKRAPLLFDGIRSVLIVDPHGFARTEVQRHRFERLSRTSARPWTGDGWGDSGSLVAEATGELAGVGFFVRADRSIWTFVDGQPLLVRRGEHWTAFPLELSVSISNLIGGGRASSLVARAAFMISGQPHGAIFAIVDDVGAIDGVVSLKDRYDLRNDIDAASMRPETWLHHLIDAIDLDEQTLARVAALDGATVLDRDGRLVAYGAIVTSADSEHEGARTSAARTLSHRAQVVLKVSVDGDITIFKDGAAVTTLLGSRLTGA
jgi:hypothetical protein